MKSPSQAIAPTQPKAQPKATSIEPAADPESGQTPTELARTLAALKHNTEEILEHKRRLEQLNGWFEVALDNMARGLSMFDAEQRLIVCNKIYRDIYGLPAELTQPRTPLSDIVRYHVRRETGGERLEDVETRDHLDTVEGAGCEVQGFYFSHPVPSSEVAEMLALCRLKCIAAAPQRSHRRPQPRRHARHGRAR